MTSRVKPIRAILVIRGLKKNNLPIPFNPLLKRIIRAIRGQKEYPFNPLLNKISV